MAGSANAALPDRGMAESRVELTEGAEALRAHAAASRVEALARHLGSAAATGPSRAKSTAQAGAPPSFDDVLIIAAVRTPIGKARRGVFKDTTPDVLLATVLKEAQSRSGVPMHAIGDICVGEVARTDGLNACARGAGAFASATSEALALCSRPLSPDSRRQRAAPWCRG